MIRPASSPTVVCVLGMHRSGTSVVTRLLSALGVYLGPEHLISNVGSDNPKGYWEHHPLALLNDEILARFGGQWHQPPAFPSEWWRAPELADLKEKAQEIVGTFAGQPLWGWKDPRTCLTLPFWRDIVGPIRYVLAFRNPCEVVASLQRRDAMSAEKAERLWLAHAHASLTHTSGQDRLIVFYDEIMNDSATNLARLAAFVGRPAAADEPAVRGTVADFLDETLRHHRMSLEDLATDRRVSFPATSLYLAIRGHAHALAPDRSDGEDRSRLSLHHALDVLGARAVESCERSAANAAERDALSHAHHEQAAAIAQLTGSVTQLTETVASLESDLLRITRDHDRLTRERDALARTLDEIHSSVAWGFVVRLRRAIAWIVPAGTRRRTALDVVLRRV
jgi:hypothetical protein